MFRCSVYTTTTPCCIKRRAPVKSFLKPYNLVSQAFSANVWSANDGKTITQWSLPAYNGLVIVIPAVYDKRGTPRLMCLCNLHNSRGKRRFAKFCALSCTLYKSRPDSNPFSHPLSAHCWSMWTADGWHEDGWHASRNCQVFNTEWSSPDDPASVFGIQRPPNT